MGPSKLVALVLADHAATSASPLGRRQLLPWGGEGPKQIAGGQKLAHLDKRRNPPRVVRQNLADLARFNWLQRPSKVIGQLIPLPPVSFATRGRLLAGAMRLDFDKGTNATFCLVPPAFKGSPPVKGTGSPISHNTRAISDDVVPGRRRPPATSH
jgi:hypothetical protein